ncbi:carbohydrate ABC transporter substrate-binding protein, CUT1 family [Arthrobacter alpinus]|uniref:Carbohydrate ABC transporter substrate-binding protein, CUT1 family n=2 Tax=Arthrobacter alpinus TaxID=656366 RepID=A0A1H5MH06_9MICC|nr:carbohydrate ABC transporter substrate-binding protein, CUT1 family [Arthrobacter alpinus]
MRTANEEVATAMKGNAMNFMPDRRTYLKLSVLAASAVGLAACGSEAGADGPVTLRFTWWGGDARHKTTQQIIEKFNMEHPNITVKGEYSDWTGYWDKLATQVAGNDAPDIIQMDEKYVREYGDRGALLDLNRLESLEIADFAPDAVKSGEIDGKLHGLVIGLGTFAIAVNPEILEKAGISMPDDKSWSWQDYLELGSEVSRKVPGSIGIGLGYSDIDLYYWARQQGDRLYDGEAKVVIKPETLSSFWQLRLDASKSGSTDKPAGIFESAGAPLDQSSLATGKMAFGGIFNTQLPAYNAAKGQDLKLLRIPGEAQAKERAAYYKSSMFWSLSARTKHQGAAETFLNYLSNSQEAGDLILTERGIPANAKIRESITGKLGPEDTAAVEFSNAIAEEARPAPPITPVGGSIIESILARYMADVLFEKTTPVSAATAFIEEIKTTIQR